MAFPTVQKSFDAFALRGGLDLHTPQLSLKPGVARSALNFEVSITGGYTRVPGYERYDGQTSPGDALWNIGLVNSTPPFTAADGEIVTVVSDVGLGLPNFSIRIIKRYGAVFTYAPLGGLLPASFELRNAGGALIGAGLQGPSSDPESAISDETMADMETDARAAYRNWIGPVPGVGPVLGIFVFNGYAHAWRASSGGAAVLHRASASGWQAIPAAIELRFTAGTVAPSPGGVITQGAAIATVRRVILESGTWASGTAAGRVILASAPASSFAAGGGVSGMTATLSGPEAAAAMLPGGRFEHVVADAGNGILVYGCDGVNKAFEFDGTAVVKIATTNTVDVPTHIAVHQRYLFLSFLTPPQAGHGRRASVQHSGVADPFQWTAISGAAEIVVDDPVTGFLKLPGSETSPTLAILSSAAASILYGASPSTWQRVPTAWAVGAKAYTARSLSHGLVFTDMGVTAIESVQSYGNFRDASLTVNLRDWVRQRRQSATEALINREKSQYRVFFEDGSALYCTMAGGRFTGAMPLQFPHSVRVACSGDSINGSEVSFFGSTDGFVYKLDTGASFDGQPIEYHVELAFASQGNARIKKRYRRASIEVNGTSSDVTFNVGYLLGYGDDLVLQSAPQEKPSGVSSRTAAWDSAMWDVASWDGRTLSPAQVPLEGSERNISLRIDGASADVAEFTLNSITIHYTPRGELRD